MNQVKISCVICGKDRSSEVDMNKHMKKHRDDRYFCCDICIFKTVQLKKVGKFFVGFLSVYIVTADNFEIAMSKIMFLLYFNSYNSLLQQHNNLYVSE